MVLGQCLLLFSSAETSSKISVSILLNLPGELLSVKFRLKFMKADGCSSVEVSSSADSFIPSNASVPVSKSSKKLKSSWTLHLSKPYPRLLALDWDLAAWVLPIDGLLPPYRLDSDSSMNSKVLPPHFSSRLETLAQLACQLIYLLLLRALF